STLVQKNTNLHQNTMAEARDFCAAEGVHYFKATIPKSISFANAIVNEELPLTLAKKNTEFAFYYKNLFKELTEREPKNV
ncbi:hypothetical protein ACUOAQ_32930, partial [Escherichia sp. SP-MK]